MAKRDTNAIYEKLVGDEDARVCRDISDDACNVVPGNFFRQLLALTLTKLGDALTSPKTTLTWVMAAVAAPVWMIGWLVPIREAGSLLPQLLIGAAVRRRPLRKWVWVLGAVLQAGAVTAMAASCALLEGALAGAALIAALCLFSLSRGLCSVASKDVLGKTVPKTRRGRLGGFAASLAGLVTLAVGGLLWWQFDSREPLILTAILAIAAGLWLLAAAIFASVNERPGATEGGGHAVREALANLSLLRDDAPFRRFVIARALLLVSALGGPYLVLLAKDHGADDLQGLPLFLLAAGAASLLSSPFWGRFADLSSRRTMMLASAAASTVTLAAATLDRFWPTSSPWPFVLLFFLLSMAHAGSRLGRKTYVVDLADGNRRTDYVAVSNSVMGLLLLAAGAATGLASLLSTSAALLLLVTMGIAGVMTSARLPETRQGFAR